MDATAVPDERWPARTAKSCGPGLSTLRSAQRAKGRVVANGGKKADPQGEHEGHR